MSGSNYQHGYSLLEALIAVLVLSIGLIGLAGMQMANLKSVHNSSQKQQATSLLNELTERVRNNFLGVKAGAYLNQTPVCGTPPVNMCRATSCTPSELATADVYQVMCGDSGANTGVRNTLTSGTMSITCPVACSTAIRLSISWAERVVPAKGSTNTSEFKTFDLFTEVVVRAR